MAPYRVGFIGCGRPWRTEGSTGFGMSHAHAQGYKASPDVQIVALSDINLDNAKAFQERHGGEQIYTDYHEMLANEQLDIVSICTWPALHAPMVVAAAEAGVKAIHCEKPMAPTFGEARQMVEVCEANGVQLTFNHQRRFGRPWRTAKELLKSGAIGELRRIEATCPDLFDWGTHWFDMMFFYNDQAPAEWVMGQVELRGAHPVFGVMLEGQGLAQVQFANGVIGLLETRYGGTWNAVNRLMGTDGMIELTLSQQSSLRVWGKGQSEWQDIPGLFEGGDMGEPIVLGVLDLIDALKTGREPELAGRRALQATELIFASYESSRRRGRVDLPLQIDDSPLQALLREAELATTS
jgi:predicted dehydrogenase